METDDNRSDRQRASSLESIKTKDIPTVTELREILGFGRGQFDQSRAFKKAIKQFVSEFTAEDGTRGPRFTRWRDEFHRKVFSDMANGFLEKHGREFWPDSSISQRFQYERDHVRLVHFLERLFFRQNELSHRKRAETTHKRTPGKTLEESPEKPDLVNAPELTLHESCQEGQTKETAINLDDYNASSDNRSRHPGHDRQADPPRVEPSQTSSVLNDVPSVLGNPPESSTPEPSPPDDSNMQPSPPVLTQTGDVQLEDIHDGSNTLEISESSSNTHRKRPAPPQFEDSDRQIEDSDRQTKTPRRDQEHPKQTESHDPEHSTPTTLEELSSISGRVRQPLHRQGYIMGNECLERLEPYADNPKKRRQRTRGTSMGGTRPSTAAPVAVMALESVENHHDIDSSRHSTSGDPFDSPPEGSSRRADCDTDHAVQQRSRSFTMGIMPDLGEQSLPEPAFQPEDETAFDSQMSLDREEDPPQGEEQHRVEMERGESYRSDANSAVNECQAAAETDNITASTNVFNIDYTVYNDEEEPVSTWIPPKYFFAMSFNELVEALPLKRPRGLRLCLEGAVKRKGFSRTACDQERFKLHQLRFGEMMKSWEDEIASKGGPKPSFEIIIEPLR
ncbi:hypothetical protein CEP51_001565 [Fusarium floridanum]|uniref:Uncharacterized protein n=1 Tax=Fusarium floridanum TaxID=1325733 RepID=A0A428SGA4_9HYPO|nr:hypothetical protein CEP51_001565 [Fusarium floridanum]